MPNTSASRTGSRKVRRLRWTVVFLAVGVVAGAVAGAWIYLATRPEPYRPGEDDTDITRSLSRGLPADAPLPRFTDVTAEAGLAAFVQFVGNRTSQLPEDMGSGAAWGDYDNDGDEDLFLVGAGGSLELPAAERARSELYENLGNATFRRVAGFPDLRVIGMGAAWGDYDGDGRLDLVVTGYRSLVLFRNLPDGFVRDERFPEPRGYWAGAAWGDYDRDGDLDLYVCGYVQYDEDDADRARATLQYGRSVPYTLNPASYRPERNLLFRNEGDGSFTESAQALGVENLAGRSLGALWHDFDDDGWPDLYLANDISDNVLYRNLGGAFEEISHAAWIADYRGAMGLAAGDWNRDGDDDLFITHWIAQENALYDSLLIAPRKPSESAETPLRFVDVADQRGLGQIALRFVGWGTEFADLDGDGWLDLVVANGSTFETEEAPKRLRPQKPMLLWSRQGEYFHDLAPASDTLSVPHVARGLALADYDDDGDLDILIVHHGEGAQLLRNEMQGGHWLKVRLRSRIAGTDEARGFGDGATLLLTTRDATLRRTVSSASFLSQSSRIVHFGLGDEPRAERLEVRWPDGEAAVFSDLEAGTTWELTQGDPAPRRIVTAGLDDRERVKLFWEKQRAAMNAIKIDGDFERAIGLFRQALELDPDHEDSLYYLANCLVRQGDLDGALDLLERLTRVNPQSHRGHKQLGTLLAMSASSPDRLDAAVTSLNRALAINAEETGVLLVLGEIALMRGDMAEMEQRLAWVCRTNPRSVGGFFLRAYAAWKGGDLSGSTGLLEKAQAARGEEWKPAGTTAEGDVAHRMHDDATPLSRFWEGWDGSAEPLVVFAALDSHLQDSSGR